MSRVALAYDSDAAHSSKSRTNHMRVNKPGDAYEVEADRVAEAVSNGGRLSSSHTGWSISKLDMSYVQRDGADTTASAGASVAPKPNNYTEGLGKIGEAFLKTDLGKQITDAAQKDPLVKGAESFFDSLPGKIVAGAAAAGTVTALAAEHKALPARLPAIPLDKVKPGLSVKITYEGPVDKPTQATVTFSYTPKSATDEKKQKQAATERQHAAWARDAADLRQFQEGLKSPQQKQQEAEDAQHALDEWVTRPGAHTLSGGIDPNKYLPNTQDQPSGPQLTIPSTVGPQRKSPTLLDSTLSLAPTTGPLATTATAKPDTDAKKKEEVPVQRKADPSSAANPDSAGVESVIHSSGSPLDPSTRRTMETRIGFDFSKVRVHTDARAADSARSLGASAYTIGNHVVFNSGRYAPDSSAGRKLLAHELTHVVQQGHSATPMVQRYPNGATFVTPPVGGVTIPPPPVPGSADDIRVAAAKIGEQWGSLLAQEDIAVDQIKSIVHANGSNDWDKMTPQKRAEWAKAVEDEFAKLPVLPDVRSDLQAAQDQGFQTGLANGYSATKFAAFMTKIGGELAILIFSSLAARGIRLPRLIARLLQASMAEILGDTEYEALKTAVQAIQAAHPELAALSTDEMVAIRAYSKESYAPVNAALRLQNAKERLRLGRFIDLMRSGLGKLPVFNGAVTRTIALSVDEAAQKYQVGATVVEDAFTSTTVGSGVASREGNILLRIESSSGHDISSIAAHPEKEVLFAPGAKFQVTGVQRFNNAFVVSMKEVPR